MRTINLYLAENRVLPHARPIYYVCHERPYRYGDGSLDAPWLYCSEDLGRAQSYADAVARSVGGQHFRYEVVPGLIQGRWCH